MAARFTGPPGGLSFGAGVLPSALPPAIKRRFDLRRRGAVA
jgi:hypothetical protein